MKTFGPDEWGPVGRPARDGFFLGRALIIGRTRFEGLTACSPDEAGRKDYLDSLFSLCCGDDRRFGLRQTAAGENMDLFSPEGLQGLSGRVN